SRRRHTRLVSDWSSDLCSSDLRVFDMGCQDLLQVFGPQVGVDDTCQRAEDLEQVLASHVEYPLTRGVRQEAWFDPASSRADVPRVDLMSDPAWREGYLELAGFGLSFDLLVWPSQLPNAVALAAEVPAVPIVLEHMGLPDP